MNKNIVSGIEEQSRYPDILKIFSWLGIAVIMGNLLVIAYNLLIPLVFAFLIWYLINSIDYALSRVEVKGISPPRALRLILILSLFALAFNIITGILVTNVSRIIEVAPQYQLNLEKILQELPFGIKVEEVPALSRITTEFDIGRLMQRIARELAGFLGDVGLILIYLIFLFLEQRYFNSKIKLATSNKRKEKRIRNILAQIDRDIRRYIGIKTLLSFTTAVASWVIMKQVGLDFPGFWAILIFILNFIPHMGSIGATILPALLALLQFDTYRPFLIILLGIGAIQFTIGNLLDPTLMGKSLNVSPLVIIFSLVFWGSIWGLAGMFLAVPIMVIIMIVLYNFKKTRWLARVLSRDGKLN
ncbi:MAG: AI-2E family transporter [Elusimicrobiota bacterium]